MLWCNGDFIRESEFRVSAADRGLALGESIFETMGVSDGEIRFLAAHVERFARGADLLGLSMPDALADRLPAIAREFAKQLGGCELALRLTLSGGPGPRGLDPPDHRDCLTWVQAFLRAPGSPTSGDSTPGQLTIVAQKVDENSALSAIKSGSRLPLVLARAQAKAMGAQDAILCNQAGRIACTSAANLFVLIDDQWRTPLVSEGAMPGIIRGALLAAGMRVRDGTAAARHCIEHKITLADLARAQAAFITNALIGIQPVAQIGDRTLPIGEGVSADQIWRRLSTDSGGSPN